MSDYPEHEKLHQISGESNIIGAFLDIALPVLGGGMVIYERQEYTCDCRHCKDGKGWRAHQFVSEDATRENPHDNCWIEDGVQHWWDWQPTRRTIQSILAEAYGIDQAKIDDEREAMLQTYLQRNSS